MSGFTDLLESVRVLLSHLPVLSLLAGAPYLFRPFVLLLALGVVCGAVGVLVNLRCAEFHAEAIVHAVFPGVVVGAVTYGIKAIIPAASVAGALAALTLTWVGHRSRKDSSEAGTAIVLTTFFSVGMVVLLAKGDMSGQLEALMFGRLLEMTAPKLAQGLGVCAVALLLAVATWKEQVAYAFDAVGARAGGSRVVVLDMVFHAAVAAVVVSASTAVGTLLVIGYIVIPAATGKILASSVRGMVVVATAVGIVGGLLGMLLMTAPLQRSVSPQACVVLTMAVLLLAAAAWSRLRGALTGPSQSAVAPAQDSVEEAA